jgi:hypothetical protein
VERDEGRAVVGGGVNVPSLASEWRMLSRLATAVAVLTAPAVYALAHNRAGMTIFWSVVAAVAWVAVFRGAVDVIAHRLVPYPAASTDAAARHRHWFWKLAFGIAGWLLALFAPALVAAIAVESAKTSDASVAGGLDRLGSWVEELAPLLGYTALAVAGLALAGLVVRFAPSLLASARVHVSEPGDAGWGVDFADVPGPEQAKGELQRLVTLWEAAAHERGVLLLGPPETPKAALARAAATALNCPLVTVPGSGLDAPTAHRLARRARTLAAKWGRCVVLVDEFDASAPAAHLLAALDAVAAPARRSALAVAVNTLLDALYVVPRAIGPLRLRVRQSRAQARPVHFVVASSARGDALDAALARRLPRRVTLRAPNWDDRGELFERHLHDVAHDPALDTPRARDELARITAGHSPAMIGELCTLALERAHADGRDALTRQDLLDALATVEAGTAVGRGQPIQDERAAAIHEAGHAVCGHLFVESGTSARLSVRGRTGGGRDQLELDQRAARWRSEEVGGLIRWLGAYAAEHVFYGQHGTGVAADLGAATQQAAWLVSLAGMAPAPLDLSDRLNGRGERELAQERVRERFERIGHQLMQHTGGAAALEDPEKRRLAAALLGQCFVVAWNTIRANMAATEMIADRVAEAGELYGDDVLELLNSARLRKPEIDVLDESTWPVI